MDPSFHNIHFPGRRREEVERPRGNRPRRKREQKGSSPVSPCCIIPTCTTRVIHSIERTSPSGREQRRSKTSPSPNSLTRRHNTSNTGRRAVSRAAASVHEEVNSAREHPACAQMSEVWSRAGPHLQSTSAEQADIRTHYTTAQHKHLVRPPKLPCADPKRSPTTLNSLIEQRHVRLGERSERRQDPQRPEAACPRRVQGRAQEEGPSRIN